MTETLYPIIQALFLVGALSVDALIASFSYGANKIKIPFKSAFVIDLISSLILALALFIGTGLGSVISKGAATALCCSILIVMGLIKLFDSFIKSYIRKHKSIDKNIKFNFLSLKFIINIYADPPEADTDESKFLSVAEAVSLAIALSLDSLTVGIGAGLIRVSYILIIAFSLLADLAAVYLGQKLGARLASASKKSLNISWLSGGVLIALALVKLFL